MLSNHWKILSQLWLPSHLWVALFCYYDLKFSTSFNTNVPTMCNLALQLQLTWFPPPMYLREGANKWKAQYFFLKTYLKKHLKQILQESPLVPPFVFFLVLKSSSTDHTNYFAHLFLLQYGFLKFRFIFLNKNLQLVCVVLEIKTF